MTKFNILLLFNCLNANVKNGGYDIIGRDNEGPIAKINKFQKKKNHSLNKSKNNNQNEENNSLNTKNESNFIEKEIKNIDNENTKNEFNGTKKADIKNNNQDEKTNSFIILDNENQDEENNSLNTKNESNFIEKEIKNIDDEITKKQWVTFQIMINSRIKKINKLKYDLHFSNIDNQTIDNTINLIKNNHNFLKNSLYQRLVNIIDDNNAEEKKSDDIFSLITEKYEILKKKNKNIAPSAEDMKQIIAISSCFKKILEINKKILKERKNIISFHPNLTKEIEEALRKGIQFNEANNYDPTMGRYDQTFSNKIKETRQNLNSLEYDLKNISIDLKLLNKTINKNFNNSIE